MPELTLHAHARESESSSVSAWAFAELSRRIVDGVLPPGERITEEALVRELGVSRTPLREAIRQLEELGLILRQRNRTLRVAPLQSEELVELVRLREYIEGLAAAELTRKVATGAVATTELRDILQAIADAETRMEGADRIDRIYRLGTVFHARLVELAGLPHVARIHTGLQLALARYRRINARDRRRLTHRSVEHYRIIEAIECGDPDAAEAEMRSHIREALRAYTTNPEEGDATLAPPPPGSREREQTP